MVVDLYCSSCNKRIANIEGSTKFKCPGCTKHEFVRCKDCRKTATKYKCPQCSFTGPN